MSTLAASTRHSPPSGVYTATDGQTDFAAGFPLLRNAAGDPDGVYVQRTRAGVSELLQLDSDFTVPSEGVGTFVVRLNVPALTGDRCVIVGQQPIRRDRAHPLGGAVRTPTLEGDAMQFMASLQEARRDLDRAFLSPFEGLEAHEGKLVGVAGGKWAFVEGGSGGDGPVLSVNGRNGTVVLNAGDVLLGNVDNTRDVDKPVSAAQLIALNAKLDKAGGVVSGPLSGPDPTLPAHYTTKQYVDTLATGFHNAVGGAVATATTANITLSGEQTIDGVLTSASRVLVKNQSAPAQNGIYVSAAGAWARAADADSWAELVGLYVFVSGGTAQGSRGYTCNVAAGGTLGTTAVAFGQFSASAAYTAGNGLDLASGQFTVDYNDVVAGLVNKTVPGAFGASAFTVTAYAALIADASRLSMRNAANSAYFRVAGADPAANEDFVTRQWATANLGGPAASGVLTVMRSASTGGSYGKIDLSAVTFPGQLVKVIDGAPGDNNIWEPTGLPDGWWVRLIFQSEASLVTEKPFGGGHSIIYTNWNADAVEHDSLAVAPTDMVDLIKIDATHYLAYLHDSLGGRAAIPGGGIRNPLESIRYWGKVGKWDAQRNVMWADFGHYQQGTVRKPLFSGAEINCINDTGGFYWALFKTATGEGLESLDYAIPRTDLQTMSSQMIIMRGKVYGLDGVTLEWAGGQDPDGYTTSPGSVKAQGFGAYLKMHHTALPTRKGVPVGWTLCSSPPETSSPVARLMGQPDGSIWALGKAAVEVRGSLGARLAYATLSNISQWNMLGLDYDTITTVGAGNFNVPLTPAESAGCGFWSAIAMRRYHAQGDGLDIFDRTDETLIWLGAVQGGSRGRGVGFRPGEYGYFHHIEGGQAPGHVQGGLMQFATGGGENQIINVRPGYMGHLVITLTNGKTALFGIPAGNGPCELVAGDAAVFSGVNGTASRWNLDKSGGDVRLQKNTAGAGDAMAALTH